MKLFGFEKAFLAGVLLSLLCMGFIHAFAQQVTRTTGEYILYAMMVAAGLCMIGVLTPISRWKDKKAPFCILGMGAFTVLTFGYATSALITLSTHDIQWFDMFTTQHFGGLTWLTCIGLAVYVLFERERLRIAVFG